MGRVEALLEKKKKEQDERRTVSTATRAASSAGTGRVQQLMEKKGLSTAFNSSAPANARSKAALAELQTTGSTTYAGKTYTAPVRTRTGQTRDAYDASVRQSYAERDTDQSFLSRLGATLSGTGKRQISGYAGALENLLEGLGSLGSALQDKKEAQLAAQDREYLAQHEWELADALAAGDEEAAKWAQIKINQAKYRLKTSGALGDYYDSVTEEAVQDLDAFGDRMSAASQADLDRAKAGSGVLGRLAVDAGVALGDVIGDAAANAILPGAGTAGRVARSYGHGVEYAEDKGFGGGTQALYGAASAALGELTNRAFSSNPILEKATGKGALDDIILPGLEKSLPGRVVKSGLGEALEEGTENVADYFAQRVIMGDKADEFNWKDVGYDALIGGLVGGATGVSGGRTLSNRQAERILSDPAAVERLGVALSDDMTQSQRRAAVKAALRPATAAQTHAAEPGAVTTPASTAAAQSDAQHRDVASIFGENGQKAYRLGDRGDVDADIFRTEFARAYNAGLDGRTLNSASVQIISPAQAGAAYEAGKSDAALRNAARTEVVQYGAKQRDAGLAGDAGRAFSLASQEPGGVLAERADTAPAGRSGGAQAQRADEIRAKAEAAGLVSQSTASLGIGSGTSARTVKVLPSSLWTEEMRALSREQGAKGRQVVYFTGAMELRENGEAFHARGAVSGDGKRIWVRADHDALSVEQIARHEEYHAAAKKDSTLNKRLKEQIAQKHGDGWADYLTEAYTDLYFTDKSGNTTADIDYIVEEILADTYAGIDILEGRDIAEARTTEATGEVREAVQAADNENTARDGGVERYSLDASFDTDFDAWIKNTTQEERLRANNYFLIGTTSDALQSIGVKDYRIFFSQSKIARIMKDHPEMTADVIKSVPEILEDPILVMQSQTVANRITMFGEVMDADGKPVLVAVELSPRRKRVEVQDFAVIASAYGKNGAQQLIDSSEILYVDPNKKRTDSWLRLLGLQLPSRVTNYGPIHSITTVERDVNGNISFGNGGKTAMQAAFEKAQEKKDGQTRFSRETANPAVLEKLTEEERAALSQMQEDIRTTVREELDRLGAKYGWIEAGEKPVREVKIPKKTSDDKKVSQTVRTVLEAGATSGAMIPDIEGLVAKGDFSYDVYTDKQAIENAAGRIRRVGWGQALADWTEAVKKGEVSKKNTAMGWALYNNAAHSGDVKTAITILGNMVEHQRSAAQALQATRILKKLPPETQLYAAQRSVEGLQEEINERYGDKNAPELKINEELAERFMNARDQAARDEALKDIYRDIGRQMPSRFQDKWNAWRYLAMLGNPRTHVRNVVGNAGFAPVVAAKNLTATAIEAAVSRVSGGKLVRTKSAVGFGKQDRKLLSAAWGDYAKVQEATLSGGKYSDFANANKYIEEGRVIFKTKPLETFRKGNSKALDVEDTWFAQPHYAYALAQYCKAHNISAEEIATGKGLKQARAYAVLEAQKATYRDTNALSQTISEIGRTARPGKDPVHKGMSLVMEGILPFRKTPANILARGVEYSPIGLLNGIKQAAWDVRKGKKTGAEAIDSIASGLTGTGLLGLGVYLAAQGLVRGHGGGDEKEKTYEEMLGHQAYSLEVGGNSVTLDWLAPECLPFFVGVNLWEQTGAEEEQVTLSNILSAVATVSEPMLEMSCLQSLNGVFDAVGYAASDGLDGLPAALASAATSYLTQGFPTFLGQAERTGEDVRMTTYTEKNAFLTSAMQYTLGRASARLPGLEYQQIPYIDAWGRTETSGAPGARVFNNFLNPAYTSTIEISPMEDELLRLYQETGEAGVLPNRAAKYFTVDGVRKDLTAEEYVTYATLKGQKSYELISDLTASKEYQTMTSEEQVRAVEEAFDFANQTAKEAISAYETDSWIQKAAEAEKKYNIPTETYIAMRTRTAGIGSLKDAEGETIPNSKGLLIMQEVYNMPGLSDRQRMAMFGYLGVGKSVIHYNRAAVKEQLEKLERLTG